MITNKLPARRRSAQRERIWRIVADDKSHPTALRIYDRLRRESPNVSLGNVYRNLGILAEEGRLLRRAFKDGAERFDASTGDHCHFVCDRCRAIIDLDLPIHAEITAEAGKKTSHEIKGHTIQFYGTCTACREQVRPAPRTPLRKRRERR